MLHRATAAVVASLLLVGASMVGSAVATPVARGAGRDPSYRLDAPPGTKRLPPLLAPAVPDALSRALAQDQISAGRYALERAASLFDVARVRARFGAVARPDPRSATLVLRDLALRLGQLAPEQRREAHRILARPSEVVDPFGHAYAVPEELPVCGAHTCVHYVGSTPDHPPLRNVSGGPAPDHVETVSTIMEAVWAVEVDGHGYRPPKPDATSSPENGGDARLDVYLVDIGDEGIYGYCASDDPHLDSSYKFWDMSAYCVLDDDYRFSQFGYPNRLHPLKVTAAHEFFHAVQFGYDIAEDVWLMESTATWMEERVYDGINDNRQYLVGSPLGQPMIPLDRDTGLRVYGAWIFWAFLTEYLGGAVPDATIVRQVWKRADGRQGAPDMYSTRALRMAVGARRIDGIPWRLRWAFADFGVWNARPAKFYDEGRAYRTAPVARTVTLTRAAPSTRSTAALDHLTNRFLAVRRGAGVKATARLRVVVDGPADATGPEASVLVIRRSGKANAKPILLNRSGNGAITVGFDRTVARVVLIATNASTRYRNCFSGLTPYACFGGTPVDENRTFTIRAAIV